MKGFFKNNEAEYLNEVRQFRKSKINGQKKKLPKMSPANFKKQELFDESRADQTQARPKRKYMKKYFLVRRLNPRKKKEKVQNNDSEDIYFT